MIQPHFLLVRHGIKIFLRQGIKIFLLTLTGMCQLSVGPNPENTAARAAAFFLKACLLALVVAPFFLGERSGISWFNE